MKTSFLKFGIVFPFVAFILLGTGVEYMIYATAHLDSMYLVWSDEFEARVKLPSTPNLVAAFWMVHEEGKYGWWPEIGDQ